MFSSINTVSSISNTATKIFPPNYSFLETSTSIYSSIHIDSSNIDSSYNWPICIFGGTVLEPIIVYIDNSINIVNTNQYFIILTDYVIFEGSYNRITISALSYPGLIQNGTDINKAFNYITVQNVLYTATGTCLNDGGWIGQYYYGKNKSIQYTNFFNNCCGNAIIVSTGGGGLSGAYSFISINNCITSVDLLSAPNGGGVVGENSNVILNNCYVRITSATARNSGGLCGYNSFIRGTNCLVYVNSSFGIDSYAYNGYLSNGSFVNSCVNYINLFPNSNLLKYTKYITSTLTNCYFNQNLYWNTSSANSVLSNISSWTDICLNVYNFPKLLSSFNYPLYNSNNIFVDNLPFTSASASSIFNNFQIISINNNYPNFYPDITINPNNGQIILASTLVSNTYTIRIYATVSESLLYSVCNYIMFVKNNNYPYPITKTIMSTGHTLFSGSTITLTRDIYNVAIKYNYLENGVQVYFNNGIYKDISNNNYYTVYHYLDEVGNNNIYLNYDVSINMYTLSVGGGGSTNGGGGGVDIQNITLQPNIFSSTGGDFQVTTQGYTYVVFKNNGNITFNKSGSVEYLIIGGGGSGGNNFGGGGGAGEVISGSINVNSNTYSITVGSGGSSGDNPSNGNSSSAFGITAIGGGHGGYIPYVLSPSVTNILPSAGGSGGGGGSWDSTTAYHTDNTNPGIVNGSGLGNNGGYGGEIGGGGGGGGGGSIGTNGILYSQGEPYGGSGGNGGNGTTCFSMWISSISSQMDASWNTATSNGYIAAGGGGFGWGGPSGIGGFGGGGNGGNNFGDAGVANYATNAVYNTGSGGGGASYDEYPISGSGAGGSGIVIIRYKSVTPEIINAKVALGTFGNQGAGLPAFLMNNIFKNVTYYPVDLSFNTYLTFTNLNKRIIAYNGGSHYFAGASGSGYNRLAYVLDSSYNIIGSSLNGTQGFGCGDGVDGGGGAGTTAADAIQQRIGYQPYPDNCGGSGRQFNLYGMNKGIYWGGGGGGRARSQYPYGGYASGGYGGGGGGAVAYAGPGRNDTYGITTSTINPNYGFSTYNYGGNGGINTGGGGGANGGMSPGSSTGGSGIVILSFEHKTGYNLTPIDSSNILIASNILYVYDHTPNFTNGYYTTSASTIFSGAYNTKDPFLVSPTQVNGWASDASYNSSGVYIGDKTTTDYTNYIVYSGEWLQICLPEYFFLTNYSLVPNSNAYTSFPKQFTVLGSVDGINWVLLDTQTNTNVPTTSTAISYSLTFSGRTPSNYIASKYLRIVTNSTFNGNTVNIVSWNITTSYGFTSV